MDDLQVEKFQHQTKRESQDYMELPTNLNLQHTIVIRNFTSHVSEKQLATLFSLFGTVVFLRILRRYGKTNLRAIVTFKHSQEAQAALKLLECHNINWKTLVALTFWSTKNFIYDLGNGVYSPLETHLLCVENLPPRTSLDRVEALFSVFGNIAKIATTGENRALRATIWYDTSYSAEAAAVCMDGFLEGKRIVNVCVIVGNKNDTPIKMRVINDVSGGLSPWELRELYVKIKSEIKQANGTFAVMDVSSCCSSNSSPAISLPSTGASVYSENEESEISHQVSVVNSQGPIDIFWTKLMASKNLTVSFIMDVDFNDELTCYATYEGDVTKQILPCTSSFRPPLSESTIFIQPELVYLQVSLKHCSQPRKQAADTISSGSTDKYFYNKKLENLYLPFILHLCVTRRPNTERVCLSTSAKASVDITNFSNKSIVLTSNSGERHFYPVPYEMEVNISAVPLEPMYVHGICKSFNCWNTTGVYNPHIPGIGKIKMKIPNRIGVFSFLFPTHAIIEKLEKT